MTIISHSNRFIYCKCCKVASTSTEVLLRQFCSGRDVTIPLTARDEKYAVEMGLPAINFTHDHKKARQFYTLIEEGDIITAQRGCGFRRVLDNHATMPEIRDYVGKDAFASYFKFATERHPYSKFLSGMAFNAHRYNSGELVELDKDDYRAALEKWCDRPDLEAAVSAMSNTHLYLENGEPLVDHILRFENLAGDLSAVLNRLGLHSEMPLPELKVVGGVGEIYHDLIPDEVKQLIVESESVRFFVYD